MPTDEIICKNLTNKRVKYSGEFKLYVIIYMKEHHLSNREAMRRFLPNQKGSSAKTIREWLYVYNTKGPNGFFTMKNNTNTTNKINTEINKEDDFKPTVIIPEKISLEGKSEKELIAIIKDLQMRLDVYAEVEKIYKKKVNLKSQMKKKL